MSIKNVTVAAAIGIASLAAPQAIAQAMPERGWYVGGSFGQMEADGDCVAGFSCDFKDSSWKIFGGYRINRNFAAEGFYGNWGEITVNGPGVTATGELTSFGIAALGILPLGQFELFGKLGLANSETDVTATGPGATVSDRDSGSDLLFGFGAAYNFTRNLGVRAEWERLNDSEVNVLSIGVQYRF